MSLSDYDDCPYEGPENEPIKMRVAIVKETKLAVMFLDDKLRPIWLPKSQIDIVLETKGMSKLYVPEWLVYSKELEDDPCILSE